MTSFYRPVLDRIHIRSLVKDIKIKFMKITIFKKQIFCLGFKYKSHELILIFSFSFDNYSL